MEEYIPHMRIYFIIKFLIDLTIASVGIAYVTKFIYRCIRLLKNQIRYLARSGRPFRNFRFWKRKGRASFLRTVQIPDIELTPEEEFMSSFLVHPNAFRVEWENIVGRRAIIEDLFQTVVTPILNNHPFARSSLHGPPTGILIYGPHGCGKSLFGHAIATAAGGHFLNIQTHAFMYSQFGTEALLTATFSLAKKLAPCIIYIENIDNFLLHRRRRNVESLGPLRDFFMHLWKTSTRDNWVVVIATVISPMLLEDDVSSMMDVQYRCGLPSDRHREALLHKFLQNMELGDDIDLYELSSETNGMTVHQLKELCRLAGLMTLDMDNDERHSLRQQDLICAKNRVIEQRI